MRPVRTDGSTCTFLTRPPPSREILPDLSGPSDVNVYGIAVSINDRDYDKTVKRPRRWKRFSACSIGGLEAKAVLMLGVDYRL